MFEIIVMIRSNNIWLPVTVFSDLTEDEATQKLDDLRSNNPHNTFEAINAELDG